MILFHSSSLKNLTIFLLLLLLLIIIIVTMVMMMMVAGNPLAHLLRRGRSKEMPLDEHAPGQPDTQQEDQVDDGDGDGVNGDIWKYVHIYWCKKWMEIEQNYVNFGSFPSEMHIEDW